jgi:transposase
MSNNFIHMNKLRQILKMYSQGLSKLSISDTIGTSRNTVKSYIKTFEKLGKTFEELNALSDADLNSLFKRQVTVRQEEELKELFDFFPTAEKKLARRGVSVFDLCKEYIITYPEGLGRTAFYRHYATYKKRVSPSMHIDHKAGDKIFIDFAGETYPYADAVTGEVKQAQIFLSILGASQLTYIEAIESQQVDDLIICCIHSLEYFGGAPLAIVPDNLKSAVTKSHRYEPRINENFDCFARHYGMAVVPARAYKPKDKALVENAVKISYQRVLKNLGNDIIPLAELNVRMRLLLEEHNNTPLTNRDYSRRERFEELERSALQALPLLPYELRKQVKVTVLKTGHIMLNVDKHYYSAPYTYIGKKVKVLYSKSYIEIFHKYEKIAEHHRLKGKGSYTTIADHMATSHKVIMEWTPEKFMKEAAGIHPDVEFYIAQVLLKKSHPEQAYRSCNGILSYAKRKGNDVLISACQHAHYLGRYSFKAIENIILGGLDKLEWKEDASPAMPNHENIRGENYYK